MLVKCLINPICFSLASFMAWEPSQKQNGRTAENADNVKQPMKAVQAALCYALTTPEQSTTTKANVATLQPRMLDTKVINEESSKDPATKELKQMVEGGVSQQVKDWP